MKRTAAALGLWIVTILPSLAGCDTTIEPPIFEPPEQELAPPNDPGVYTWIPGEPAVGEFVLIETTTGSVFNLRGEAIDGPLADENRLLEQFPGVNMFWFAWSVFYPGSEIWGRETDVRDADLPSEKSGISGCFGGIDCIPSLPNTGPPAGALNWTDPGAPDAAYLADSDLVIGVFERGVARAYPHNILWWHEVANDQIGDQSFTVTFCPLTGSGLVFAAEGGEPTFGVSGNLFNSNLVLYDHQSESLWPQLWTGAVSGFEASSPWLELMPHSEMTWRRWKELHPDTIVLSSETGFARNYMVYPYGSYRTDHTTTFLVTDPLPDPQFLNKEMTFGLFEKETGDARAYVHRALLEQVGSRGVIEDTFAGAPLVIAFDLDHQLVVAFMAETTEGLLAFEADSYEP